MLFYGFWRDSKDRLFAFFGAGFWILALDRVAVSFIQDEYTPFAYLIRLAAFLLIIVAIIDRNRR
jgi:Ni/Fe-hydrogenase subunit HybB-like protein